MGEWRETGRNVYVWGNTPTRTHRSVFEGWHQELRGFLFAARLGTHGLQYAYTSGQYEKLEYNLYQ